MQTSDFASRPSLYGAVLDIFFRRPLFYVAIFFCFLIASVRFLAPGYFNAVRQDDVYWLAKQNPGVVWVRGKIVSEVDRKQNYYGQTYDTFILQCQKIRIRGRLRSAAGKTRVTLKNPVRALRYGDIVVLPGELVIPKGRTNPGGFDYREYLGRQGVYTQFFSHKKFKYHVALRDRGNLIIEKSLKVRQFLSTCLSEDFPDKDAAFLKALLLGERDDITAEFQDLFIRTGTLHILAVSGFNVGFLCAAVFFFFAPFPISKNARWFIALGAIWLYCLVVGWQAPLVRASVMATILILGRLLGRKADLLNSLGLAAILILAVNPKNFFDAGFQLSFLSVAGMALFVPLFVRPKDLMPNEKLTLWEKMSFWARELFWVSFVAIIVTLPVTVQYFYTVAPLALAANMIVVPLAFWLFVCGIAYFLTFGWVPKIIFFIPLVLRGLMQVFLASLNWIAQLPLSLVTVGRLSLFLEFLLIGMLAYSFFSRKIKGPLWRACIVILVCVNVFLFQDVLRRSNHRFVMTVLDVGEGDAIYFEFPKGGNMLVDAGRGEGMDAGRRVVVPFLKSKGVRTLDAVVFSHPQSDHIGGMSAVFKEIKIKNVFEAKKYSPNTAYLKLKKEIDRKKIRHVKIGGDRRITGFRGISAIVLAPDFDQATKKNANEDAIVLKVVYGKTAFLLTSDIEGKTMKRMIQTGADIKADVLKVPHHGAKLTDHGKTFVREVSPKISIISVGERNPYGHPRAETLEALSSISGNQILRTDRMGAISIVSDGHHVKIIPSNYNS